MILSMNQLWRCIEKILHKKTTTNRDYNDVRGILTDIRNSPRSRILMMIDGKHQSSSSRDGSTLTLYDMITITTLTNHQLQHALN